MPESFDVSTRSSRSAPPLVVAVVLNYKNYEQTITCVRALLRQQYQSLKCVVVDNASPNDSMKCLQRAFSADPGVVLLGAPSNGGYAFGNNFGALWVIEQLHPKYILILNPDVLMTELETIERLVLFAESHDDAAVVSPKVALPNGFVQGPYARPSLARLCIEHLIPVIWHIRREQHQKRYRESDSPQRCFRTIGACMLLRSDAFASIGMFDESTFMGGEEPILAEKFNRIGKYFYHDPAATVVHNHSRASSYVETIDGLTYYFREYRQASKISISILRICTKVYSLLYQPMKQRLQFNK